MSWVLICQNQLREECAELCNAHIAFDRDVVVVLRDEFIYFEVSPNRTLNTRLESPEYTLVGGEWRLINYVSCTRCLGLVGRLFNRHYDLFNVRHCWQPRSRYEEERIDWSDDDDNEDSEPEYDSGLEYEYSDVEIVRYVASDSEDDSRE